MARLVSYLDLPGSVVDYLPISQLSLGQARSLELCYRAYAAESVKQMMSCKPFKGCSTTHCALFLIKGALSNSGDYTCKDAPAAAGLTVPTAYLIEPDLVLDDYGDVFLQRGKPTNRHSEKQLLQTVSSLSAWACETVANDWGIDSDTLCKTLSSTEHAHSATCLVNVTGLHAKRLVGMDDVVLGGHVVEEIKKMHHKAGVSGGCFKMEVPLYIDPAVEVEKGHLVPIWFIKWSPADGAVANQHGVVTTLWAIFTRVYHMFRSWQLQ